MFCFPLARVYNWYCLYVDKLDLAVYSLNISFSFVLSCNLDYSSISSLFIYFIDEICWEIEGHRNLIWFGFGSWGKLYWKPTVSFRLLNCPFCLCPHSKPSPGTQPLHCFAAQFLQQWREGWKLGRRVQENQSPVSPGSFPPGFPFCDTYAAAILSQTMQEAEVTQAKRGDRKLFCREQRRHSPGHRD